MLDIAHIEAATEVRLALLLPLPSSKVYSSASMRHRPGIVM